MEKIFKDAQIVILAKIIGIILGFFNSIFLIRLLGAEGNGIYANIMATSELFMLLTTINFSLGIMYFSSKKDADYAKIMAISYRIIVTSIIATALIIPLLFQAKLLNIFIPADKPLFYSAIAILIIFLLELRQTYSSVLKGRKNFNDLFYSNTLYSSFRFCLFGALVLLQSQISLSIQNVILLHCLTLVVHALSTYYFYKKEFKLSSFPKTNLKDDYAEFFKYSGSSFIAILGTFLTSRINIWIIPFFLATDQLGYYALAAYLFTLLMQLPSTLRNVLIPYLVSGTQEEQHEYLILFSRLNATTTLIVAMIIILIADWVVPIVYGQDFSQSLPAIKLMLIAASLASMRSMFAIYFYANNKITYNVLANYLTLTIMVIASIILIPKYGITGGAISAVLAYASGFICIFALGLFATKLPLTNYIILTKSDVTKMLVQLGHKKGKYL